MHTSYSIRPSEYHDSVTLMETAGKITSLSGVLDAAVVMATGANKGILRQAGLILPEIERATANDLVIVVAADDEESADRALRAAEAHLAQRPQRNAVGADLRPHTLRGAVRAHSGANLAVISVPGQYAADEAWEALRSGLHVFLFSDNVSIEDEIALKEYAADRGLLMMGPDCGTAIINGVALGFANVVRRGPVGMVAASGTGLQEVSALLARRGVGISQGIGTGGRDLKKAVGGTTMVQGLKALQGDSDTRVLMLISKPPSPLVVERILDRASRSEKPTIVCFLGGNPEPIADAGCIPAQTLEEAAYLVAAEVEGQEPSSVDRLVEREAADLMERASELRTLLLPGQRFLRGLFSGGTLATEALLIWEDIVGRVLSNTPVKPEWTLPDATRSEAHSAVDLGEDEFTVGRPHPMLDNELRIRRLLKEAEDPEVAVILLDIVLGYGAHSDPVSELGPAIREARELAAARGRELIVVASVTGTERDPQGLGRQVHELEDAGAVVASSNAAAARLAAFTVAP
ncbi:MAG: acyl-CoA synthetase FdrA [Anaerolineae bacterium]